MRLLDLTLKDLRQLARDRQTAVFLLIMPIVFTLMFGFAFGGAYASAGGSGDPRLPVGYLDQDGGLLARQLAALLADSGVIRPVGDLTTAAALNEALEEQELAAAVVVPPDFSAALLADPLLEEGDPPSLTVLADQSTDAGRAAADEIGAAVNRLAAALRAAAVSTAAQAERVGFPDRAARSAHFEQTLAQAVVAWQTPPVSVTATSAVRVDEEGEPQLENAFAQTSPGMMAQFAIAGLMGAATILVLERKSRALQRLLTTNLSRLEILLGHYLAMVVMILAQILVLVLFGQLFLRLDYFSAPLATLLLALTTALFAAAVGLLIGALAKSEEQVVIYALIPMFILAGLGGAWVPLEITPEAFQQVARLTPLAWAIIGFQNIIVRGQGLEAVLLPAAVLLGYTTLFFVLAVWRFRFE